MVEIRSHGNMAGLRVNWINDDWISEVQLYPLFSFAIITKKLQDIKMNNFCILQFSVRPTV